MPVGVGRDQVAGAQPAVRPEHRRRLVRHAPVALHHGRVSQLELAHLAERRRPAVAHDAALVDDAERGVLADAPERAVRTGAARPDRAVRRLGHRVAADDAKAEALLDLELALLGRRRTRVAQAQRVLGIVGPLRLQHQDLEHRPDRVELGRPVPAGRVDERARREAGQKRQARARADRAEHRIRGRVDVEERQRRHQAVVGGELHPPREALAGHRVGAVGLGHELGAAGRAGGGDEDGRIVRPGRAGAVGVRVIVEEAGDVDDGPGPPAARARHHRVEAGVGDHEARAHLADEPGVLCLGAARVLGDKDRAGVGRGQPGEQIVRRAAHGGEHQVAAADPEGGEPRRRPPEAGTRLGVGERLVARHEPHLVGDGGHGGVEELGDRLRHGRGSSPVAPAGATACA